MKQIKEGYKMTELGEIPQEWNIKKLNDVFEFSSGLSLSRSNQSDNGCYYLHYGDIHKKNKSCFCTIEDKEWLPKIQVSIEDINKSIFLKTGDVVFADASEDYQGIGKSVVIINEESNFIGGLHTIIAKDKTDLLNTMYKKYSFNTVQVRNQFRKLATGTTVFGISKNNIGKICFLVPSVQEQKKIASILSSVDEQIELNDSLIKKTKELKKGLMQQLLTQGIGHDKFKDTEIGRIPEEWQIKNIEDIMKFSSGSFMSQKDIVKGIYPVYGGNGIVGFNNEFLFTEPMIVIGRVGAKCGCIHLTEEKSWITDNALYISQKLNNYSDNYMFYLLSFLDLNKFANKNAQPVISGQKLYKIKIGIPSLTEQQKIADILSKVDNQLKEYQSKKDKLQELKKGLMQQLLTGKIRVKVGR